MKILVLLNRIPYPLNDGGAIGSYQFVRGYAAAGASVHCLAMNTTKHHIEMAQTGDTFGMVTAFHEVEIDNRIRPLPALVNLFSGQSYIMARYDSVSYRDRLIALLQQTHFDIIHIDGLPPALYLDTIRQYSKARIAYRAHNVEYKIWERAADTGTNPIKALYLRIQSQRLKRFEASVLGSVDTVLAISGEDEAFIHQVQPSAHTHIVPAGIDIDETRPIALPMPPSLFFIGAMDWLPNQQGMEWFMREVWGAVHEALPALEFHIAGKKMPAHFHTFAGQGVTVHGEVDSAAAFMDQHTILISPALSGSGVRIKIIEAMAMGKVVVSTTVAAEGSGAIPEVHLLIADDVATYVAQLKRLIESPALLTQLSTNARQYAIAHFQNRNIMTRLLHHYQALCS